MRPVLVAGNWKMNLSLERAVEWAETVGAKTPDHPRLQVAVCPPVAFLVPVGKAIAGSALQLGAQNLHWKRQGAFTGEVSGPMLAEVGCRYVIVGHSERRHVMGESDAVVRRKLRAALDAGLTPILCVGELLEERDQGDTQGVVTAQLCSALAGLSAEQAARLVIAYEPVWAIGTGRTAKPEQAEEVQNHIRKTLAERYNANLAEQAVIQYGGSVKPGNAAELLAQPDVDGLLVGGASLDSEQFLAIVEAGLQAASK